MSKLVAVVATVLRVWHSPPPFAVSVVRLVEDRHETETLCLFNKKMLHLVDDIFWNMGFHNSKRQDKVPIICTYCSYM